MKAPLWLHKWVDERGRIPKWVRWLWPHAHFCPEMDYLLVIDEQDVFSNCFCSKAKKLGEPIEPRS